MKRRCSVRDRAELVVGKTQGGNAKEGTVVTPGRQVRSTGEPAAGGRVFRNVSQILWRVPETAP